MTKEPVQRAAKRSVVQKTNASAATCADINKNALAKLEDNLTWWREVDPTAKNYARYVVISRRLMRELIGDEKGGRI